MIELRKTPPLAKQFVKVAFGCEMGHLSSNTANAFRYLIRGKGLPLRVLPSGIRLEYLKDGDIPYLENKAHIIFALRGGRRMENSHNLRNIVTLKKFREWVNAANLPAAETDIAFQQLKERYVSRHTESEKPFASSGMDLARLALLYLEHHGHIERRKE